MKKIFIGMISLSLALSPFYGFAQAESSYSSYTSRYVNSSCRAFKDEARNQANIERLNKAIERVDSRISRLQINEDRFRESLGKAEEALSQVNLALQEEGLSERTQSSLGRSIERYQRNVDSVLKRISQNDERIASLVSEKEELLVFISELRGTVAPSFCIEIYEKENERSMTREERQKVNFEKKLERTKNRLDAEEERINNQIFSYQEDIDNLQEEIENLQEENSQYREIASESSFEYDYSLRYVNNVCRYIDNKERTDRNTDSLNRALISLESQIERLENTYSRTTNEKSKERLRIQINDQEEKKNDLTQFISEVEFEGRPSYCAETVIKNNEKEIVKNEKRSQSIQKRVDSLEARLEKSKERLVKNITVYEEKLEDIEIKLDGLKMKNEGYAVSLAARENNSKNNDNFFDLDSDADSLPDLLEINFGTDPFSADTDGDGYLDGVEVNHGYNPLGRGKMEEYKNPYGPIISNMDKTLDSDLDGLPDFQEIIFGTDPFNSDTDGDGYGDYEEIKKGYNPLGEGRVNNWRNPHAPKIPNTPPNNDEDSDEGDVGRPENPGNDNDRPVPPINPGEGEDPKEEDNASSTAEYLDYNRGVTVYNTIEREDFEYFSEVGVSTVRLMLMDGDLLEPSASFSIETSSREITSENIEKIMAVVEFGKEFGIKVVIDVHEFPGLNRWFLSEEKPKDDRLWHPSSEGEQYREVLVDVWGQLSDLLSNEPAEAVVYELFNEPEPKTDEDPNENKAYIWNDVQDEIIKKIRENDNTHLIVATSAYSWRMNSLLDWTPSEIVLNDPNLIVSVHGYRPVQFTIQEEAWYGNVEYNAYPDYYNEEHYADGIYWDYAQIDKIFGEIIGSFYEKYDIQVYVAEFAVNRLAPGADIWLLDMMNIMNKNYSDEIWGWSVHVWEEEVYAKTNKLAYDIKRPGMNDFTVDEKQLEAVLAGINNTEHTLISR